MLSNQDRLVMVTALLDDAAAITTQEMTDIYTAAVANGLLTNRQQTGYNETIRDRTKADRKAHNP